jgi:hypothetical protein
LNTERYIRSDCDDVNEFLRMLLDSRNPPGPGKPRATRSVITTERQAMKLSKKVTAIAATAAASAGLAIGIAGSASAAVSPNHPSPGNNFNCAHGIYAGYCGTQETISGLYIAAGRHGDIIGTRHPRPLTADFVWFADASPSAANNDKYAEFAPNGVASNLVMTEGRRGQVELEPASGAPNQKWVATQAPGPGTHFFWKNVGTGDTLRATVDGGPVLAVHGPAAGPGPSTLWNFVTP